MTQEPLEVEVLGEGEGARVCVRGELDLAGAPELEAALQRAEETGVNDITLDLREVTFIDSSGIRCVLDAYHRTRARGAELRIFSGLEAGIVFGLAGLTGRLPFVV
jgi:anti-anti-sigma factor